MAGRRLGQHFLVRRSILERIASAACPDPDKPVVEIGPGKGALTEYLLKHAPKCTRSKSIRYLSITCGEVSRRSRRIFGSTWRCSARPTLPNGVRCRLRGICRTTSHRRSLSACSRWARICCTPSFSFRKKSPTGSSRSPGVAITDIFRCKSRSYAEPKYLFTVPPDAFRPPPQGRLRRCRTDASAPALTADPKGLIEFAGLCFRQKRKMLRNNLPAHYPHEAIDAQPEARLRAEQLSVLQLADLRDRILKFQ